MNFPLWVWIVLGMISFFSLLWGFLVIHDVNHEIRSQLWVVGEENEGMVFTRKLRWLRVIYIITIGLLCIVSFLLIFVL